MMTLSKQCEVTILLLHALANLLAPEDADLSMFDEYAGNNELALALDELAAIVNGRTQ